jgi:hypothetical protein
MIQTYPGITGNIEIYMKVLRAICGETKGKSMIDLCCAFAPNTPKLGFERRMYVDIIDRILDHKEEQEHFVRANVIHPELIMAIKGIRKLYKEPSFDVAICSDGIEHLLPDDGKRLRDQMQELSHKQIIFTPLGDLWMEKIPTDNPEAHRSAWYPEMLPGWACIVFPDYHQEWKVGAFFAWKCADLEKDFERVIKLIEL